MQVNFLSSAGWKPSAPPISEEWNSYVRDTKTGATRPATPDEVEAAKRHGGPLRANLAPLRTL